MNLLGTPRLLIIILILISSEPGERDYDYEGMERNSHLMVILTLFRASTLWHVT
jgi:hypothetical protein